MYLIFVATFDMPGSGANNVLFYQKILFIQSRPHLICRVAEQTTFCIIQKACLYKVISITVYWKNSDLVTKDMQPSEDMSTLSYEGISYNFLFFSSMIFLFVLSVDSICGRIIMSACWYLQAKAAYLGSRRLTLSIFVQNIACISGGYSTKFRTGTLCPEVQPLTLTMPFLKERVPLSHTWLVPSRLLSFEAVMERSQETVKDYRRRGRCERRGKRKRESPLFAPSHFPRARASSRRTLVYT